MSPLSLPYKAFDILKNNENNLTGRISPFHHYQIICLQFNLGIWSLLNNNNNNNNNNNRIIIIIIVVIVVIVIILFIIN